MRKFLKLFLLTAAVTLAMSVMAMAEVHSDPITTDTILVAGDTYHQVTITGSDDADNPVVITVPAEGITISGDRMNYDAANDFGLKIASGYVKIVGEDGAVMYHENKEGYSTDYIIKVEKDAALTLENVTLNGRKRDGTGTPSSSERTWHGIYNNGTLNIEKGTVITNIVTLGTGYAHGCAIYNNGTVNMNGGEITGNKYYAHAGYSIITHGDVNITNGLIYDNHGYSIYTISGVLNITGGLIADEITGSYRQAGDFRAGSIDSESLANIGDTITDTDLNISIPASGIKYLVANPSHDIRTTIGEEKYVGVFNNGKWYFNHIDHETHEIILEPKELHLTTSGNNTAVINAQVVCPTHTKVDVWGISSLGNVVKIETDPNDKNICKVTALSAGEATITARTNSDNTTATCKVYVTENQNFTRGDTLKANTTYTDITISSPNIDTLTNIMIPEEGITVSSSSSDIPCITIKAGSKVQLQGGNIYHINENGNPSYAIIKVEPGASLTLNSVTIYGTSKELSTQPDTNHDNVSDAVNVKYGIYNDGGYVTMMTGAQITRVHADHNVEEDGVIYNKNGSFTLDSYSYIHDNYNCYAIYSEGGTQTIKQGVIVGFLPEGLVINGNTQTISSVYGIAPGTEITVAGAGGYNAKTVKIKSGESIVTTTDRNITAKVDGNQISGTIEGSSLQFATPVNANVSFVKKTDSSYAEPFNTSHIGEDPNDNTGAENTIATAFYTTIADMTDKTHILCDIVIPENSTSYIKTTDEGKEHFELSAIDAEGIKKAENPAEHTVRVAYDAAGAEGDQFGLIVNNFYSPNAKAYIIACTDDEYNAAVNDEYNPYEVATLASSGEEPAMISLN